MIDLSLGFISYLISVLIFLFILLIYFIGQRKAVRGKLFLILIIATIIWSGILTLSQVGPPLEFELVVIAELLRYFTWFYILQQMAGQYQQHPFNLTLKNPLSPLVVILVFCLALLTLVFNDVLNTWFELGNPVIIQISWMLFFSILGLILVEHLFRNTMKEDRDKIIYICISAGVIFAYDFFVFADALLLQKIDYEIWSARGLVNAMIVPTLVIAAVRNPYLAPSFHISREFVFHSTSLMGAGIYLILMSFFGYYIKQRSGDWGELLQSSFLIAAFVLFLSIFFSSSIKIKFRRFISRSFSYKYDYREEWNRFSDTLLTFDDDQSIYKRSLIALGQIVESRGSTLWLKDNHMYRFHSSLQIDVDDPQAIQDTSNLIRFIKHHKTLFTIQDFKQSDSSHGFNHWIVSSENSWLIIPLWNNDALFGFIHMQESVSPMQLDTEDYDLLNTVAHHISLSLSLHETLMALQQAEQFKQINQMTAFLVHDLKTLLSQLSLLVENGKIHKQNPAFVDDMLNTLEHVTNKMNRIIQQLKDPEARDDTLFCGISMITKNIIYEYRNHPVKVTFHDKLPDEIFITARESELSSALKHIIQNAVESIYKEGDVNIELGLINPTRIYIKISDNGIGMSRTFVTERLYKPFDSTKGVSGMGLGMYQCREYIHSINGDIAVSSEEGVGTTFTIQLPTKYG